MNAPIFQTDNYCPLTEYLITFGVSNAQAQIFCKGTVCVAITIAHFGALNFLALPKSLVC